MRETRGEGNLAWGISTVLALYHQQRTGNDTGRGRIQRAKPTQPVILLA